MADTIGEQVAEPHIVPLQLMQHADACQLAHG